MTQIFWSKGGGRDPANHKKSENMKNHSPVHPKQKNKENMEKTNLSPPPSQNKKSKNKSQKMNKKSKR